MADEEELSRSETVAKRAMELAARAEELARHAHEVAGVDEQLAGLEAELDALAAEEEALDDGFESLPPGGGQEGPGFHRHEDWASWAETFSDRLEALGARIGDLITGSVDSALAGAAGAAWTARTATEAEAARTAARAAGAAAAAAAGAGAGAGEAGAIRFSREGECEWPTAGPVPVQIRSHGGSVDVRGRDGDGIRVTWRARSWGGRDPEQQPVTVSDHGGIVVIESEGRRGWRASGVTLEVEVPRHSPVELTTGGGTIRVEGTEAPVSGRTGGGSITLTEIDGEVRASTGGGSIRVEGRFSGDSEIHTGGGSIDVVVRPGTRVDVDVRATSAKVDVPGLRVEGYHVVGAVDGGGDGRLHVRTGGGAARIRQG